MNAKKLHITIQRSAPRYSTAATVTCRPYASQGGARVADGIMRDFSSDGSCIEATRPFNPGTILIVRMLGYPPQSGDLMQADRPRSIGLAEVKWHQELDTQMGVRHAMGLRYLD